MSGDAFAGGRWHGHWIAADVPDFVIDATSVGGDLPPAQFSRVQFRRTSDLPTGSVVPDRVPVRVSADSRYLLWVNGVEVGRGPIRSQPRRLRYDEYDIARLLRAGRNAVAVLVTYYGRANSFELKRHFRDRGWTVQVPRRLRELGPRLAAATEELAQILHRSPTTAELATRLGVSHGDALEARQCARAYRPSSLEQPPFGRGQLHLLEVLGGLDPELEAVDRRETLRRRLARLPERQRRVLALRYFADMTQVQIAADIGVSQMQVSRLLAQSLTRLRDGVRTDGDSAAPSGPARVVRQVGADRSSRRR